MNLNQNRTDLLIAIRDNTNVRVTMDPGAAHAPCALIGPATNITVDGLAVFDVEVPVWLIAKGPGGHEAVTDLQANILSVVAALQTCGEVVSTILGTYNVGQGDLPAYEITCRIAVN